MNIYEKGLFAFIFMLILSYLFNLKDPFLLFLITLS